MKARTRFAPSPTGFLHIGGVRTALYNYLLAKKTGGQFLLRLEDTDRERYVPEGVAQIVEALEWLGLKPDEGFWISEGRHQNIEFIQSERHKKGFYQTYADKLVEQGLAYYSPTTPAELEKLREQARQEKRAFLYRKSLDTKNSNQKIHGAPIRLDVLACAKNKKNIEWDDEVMGQVSQKPGDIDDFIIIKSDGFPTYNFANVIDDHDMNITHVLRGQEFVASTPKHLLLYDALGVTEPPRFAHLPVINGEDGKKLSKRTGDTNALDYRDKGYLPEALLNFLALLGWNDGTEQEIFSLDELAGKFSLERVNNSPAVFDIKRLNWMNGHYIRQLTLDDLFNRTKTFWPKDAERYDDKYKKQVLGLVQERLKFFAELQDLTNFFFTDLPINPTLWRENKQLKKMDEDTLRNLLINSKATLEHSNFSPSDLTDRLNELLSATNQKPAVLFSLIRIATTQATASPGLADTLAVLGKEVSLRRIDAMLQKL